MASPVEVAELIQRKEAERTRLRGEIDEIAKEHIPDFHFLDYQVSMFWSCNKSPIGMCVWDIRERGFHIDVTCRYCGGPVERK